jgi:hypothetical protein
MKPKRLLPFLPPEVDQAVVQTASEYRGHCGTLAGALGALTFGQLYGWKAVWLVHSRSTIKEYEAALGISFRDHMPERTELSSRITGIRWADELGKFWAVVKGEVSVPGGKARMNDGDQPDLFEATG